VATLFEELLWFNTLFFFEARLWLFID